MSWRVIPWHGKHEKKLDRPIKKSLHVQAFYQGISKLKKLKRRGC